jgi:mannose-6-phosphate isomerase-like protein (cupin superfamily)
MKKYIKEDDPFVVPTDDLKLIEEHFGNASNKYPHCSISRIEMPPRWNEPFQTPEFDEFVLMEKGQLEIIVDGEKLIVRNGESILLKKGGRVKFTNPNDFSARYWSICLPPFTLDTVHREKKKGGLR